MNISLNKLTLAVLFLFITALFACTGLKFDRKLWFIQDSMQFTHRNEMLDDLTENYKLTGITYNKLVKLLGTPDVNRIKEHRRVFYIIEKYYGLGVDVRSYKCLVLNISADSVVLDFKIEKG